MRMEWRLQLIWLVFSEAQFSLLIKWWSGMGRAHRSLWPVRTVFWSIFSRQKTIVICVIFIDIVCQSEVFRALVDYFQTQQSEISHSESTSKTLQPRIANLFHLGSKLLPMFVWEYFHGNMTCDLYTAWACTKSTNISHTIIKESEGGTTKWLMTVELFSFVVPHSIPVTLQRGIWLTKVFSTRDSCTIDVQTKRQRLISVIKISN